MVSGGFTLLKLLCVVLVVSYVGVIVASPHACCSGGVGVILFRRVNDGAIAAYRR